MKCSKGWRQIVTEEGYEYTELTSERLKEHLQAIFFGNQRVYKDKDLVVGQVCIEQGWVYRKPNNQNLCKNPDCKACREWEKMLNEVEIDIKVDNNE